MTPAVEQITTLAGWSANRRPACGATCRQDGPCARVGEAGDELCDGAASGGAAQDKVVPGVEVPEAQGQLPRGDGQLARSSPAHGAVRTPVPEIIISHLIAETTGFGFHTYANLNKTEYLIIARGGAPAIFSVVCFRWSAI
jgi:hypothetical protein